MKRSTLALATTAILAAACGDDGTGPDNGVLTQAEAEALAGILMSQSYQTAEAGAAPTAGGPQAVPVNIETTLDVDVPCQLGGHMVGSATLRFAGDTELEGGTLDYAITQRHVDCVARDPDTGLTFTLNGNPDMTTQLTLVTDGLGALSLSGSIAGDIAWAMDQKSGSCPITLSFSGSGDASTGAGSSSVSGSVCGVSVSQEVSVS